MIRGLPLVESVKKKDEYGFFSYNVVDQIVKTGNMKIYLVGMPGCGKSTLGKILAPNLKVDFVDLDDLIVNEAGKSIKDIFKDEGEAHFRKIESRLLKTYTANNSSFLMSTGGGAPCFFDNMDFMKNHGITLFMNVPVETLMERLFKTRLEERPLLKDLEFDTALRELNEKLKARLPFYSKAHITLNGDHIDENVAASSIRNYLKSLKS